MAKKSKLLQFKTNDILLVLGLGAGALLLFTEEGQDILSDLGINVDFNKRKRRPQKDRAMQAYSDEEIQRWIDKESQYYFPIQDLYVPKGWPNTYPYYDPYRHASAKWKDWWIKGSGGYEEDQLRPVHHAWNPDYIFINGNMYKGWYPSAFAPDQKPGLTGPIPQTIWDFP